MRWAPEYGLSLKQAEDYWIALGVRAPEGGCGDAFEVIEDTTAIFESKTEALGRPTDAKFWAIEAAPKTFDYLAKSPLAKPRGPVVVVHAAANDKDGTLSFQVPGCNLF